MSQDELYSTTMDPANRHLVQLTTDDMSATLDLYNKLLGKQPSLRKEFILKNTVYTELKKEHTNLLTALYLLAFSTYEGFKEI